MADAVRQMLGSREVHGGEGERDDTNMIAVLTLLQQSPETPAKVAVALEPESSSEAADLPGSLGDILMPRTGITSAEILLATGKQGEGDRCRLGEIHVEQVAVRSADIGDALRIQQSSPAAADITIRVDAGLLDQVMNLVGDCRCFRSPACASSCHPLQFSGSQIQTLGGGQETVIFHPAGKLQGLVARPPQLRPAHGARRRTRLRQASSR
jgi:hypothetical protein